MVDVTDLRTSYGNQSFRDTGNYSQTTGSKIANTNVAPDTEGMEHYPKMSISFQSMHSLVFHEKDSENARKPYVTDLRTSYGNQSFRDIAAPSSQRDKTPIHMNKFIIRFPKM